MSTGPNDFQGPPRLPSFSASSPSPNLGSLSQSARSKSINQARGLLFVIGVLTLAVNAFFFLSARENVKQGIAAEVAKLQLQGMVFDQAKLREIEETAVPRRSWCAEDLPRSASPSSSLGFSSVPIPCRSRSPA